MIRRKILSLLLLIIIVITSINFTNNKHTFADDIAIESLDIIPREWAGEYDGQSGLFNTVKRDYEIHINSIDDEGLFKGIAIVSPSPKAPSFYSAYGSYYITGSINRMTGEISVQGTEWIQFPNNGTSWTFPRNMKGTLNINKNNIKESKINGTTNVGKWEMYPIDYSSINKISGFNLGLDNNSFQNNQNDFGKTYKLNEYYFNKLKSIAPNEIDDIQKAFLIDDAQTPKDEREFSGMCYGIAMSMGLLYEGYIGLDDLTNDNANSYYKLDRPINDEKLLNVLSYYHFSQYLSDVGWRYAARAKTYNQKVNNLDNCKENYMAYPAFLKELINHCSTNHVELLGYSWSESNNGKIENKGHAILITGCSFNKELNKYVVQLYDENSVSEDTPKGESSYMLIEKDYSGFELFRPNGTKISNDNFSNMFFLDWDALKGIISTTSHNYFKHTVISFPANSKFTAYNDSGESLRYDGQSISGDMEVYNMGTVLTSDSPIMKIETNNFNSIKITDCSPNFDINVDNETSSLSLEGNNINEANFDFDNGISFEGNNCKFKAYMSMDENNKDESKLLSLSGQTQSKVELKKDDDSLNVSSENCLDYIQTTFVCNTKVVERKYLNTALEFQVNYDGIIEKATEITGEERTTSINSNNKSSTATTAKSNYTIKKTNIKKLIRKKKSIKIIWNRVSGITGYKLQYSRYKNFKKSKIIVIKNSSKTSKTIKKLKHNRKYYFRIRTYKIISKNIIQSKWSKIKRKKCK